MRIALGIEYDGSGFHGWQSQPHGNTVQDVLERAVSMLAGQNVRLTCAGRTDAGVHALGQVAHFDTTAVRPDSSWVRGTNTHLPDSVSVRWAQQVDVEFHARFAARSRSYRYVLYNHPVRPALGHGRVGWCHRPLEVGRMVEGAAFLLGEQDFSAFRAAECQAKSPVKIVHQADVVQCDELIVFDFRASAFLQHMVRNIVGALVMVGKGKRPSGWIADLIASRDRTLAAPTFSSAGLYFAGVDYEPHWQLPENGGFARSSIFV